MSDTDDDIFAYDGGQWKQSISGFEENTLTLVRDALRNVEERGERYDEIAWHVRELARWCRAFNGELQQLRAKQGV